MSLGLDQTTLNVSPSVYQFEPLHIKVYLLGEDGGYSRGKSYTREDKVDLETLPGFVIDLEDVFEELV